MYFYRVITKCIAYKPIKKCIAYRITTKCSYKISNVNH